MELKKGDILQCIETVKLIGKEHPAFIKGNVYEVVRGGSLVNEYGGLHGGSPLFLEKHFEKVKTAETVTEKDMVTEKDLVGGLKGIPLEVVEGMLQRQYEQTGKRDLTPFQTDGPIVSKHGGGFHWGSTPEGMGFWDAVILGPKELRLTIFRDGYKGPQGLYERTEEKKKGAHDDEFAKIFMEALLERTGRKQQYPGSRKQGGLTEKEVYKIAIGAATEVFDDREMNRPALEEQLRELGIYPQTITIELNTGKKVKKLEKQHFLFPFVLKAISARVNVALVGPAGSGKTSIAHNAAAALELPFYSKSVSAQTGVHEFFGYQDANGKFVRTLFREAYENGGVFLVDEFDAGNPNVLAALNQATANGSCAFPDQMVEKHKDFIAVMAGNTYGNGATAEYVGRNKIDAATLDRFVFINVPYDEALEMDLSTNKAWCRKVQAFRAQSVKKKVKCIISPRATFNGEALLAAGVEEELVLQSVIFKNLSADEVSLLTGGVDTDTDKCDPWLP